MPEESNKENLQQNKNKEKDNKSFNSERDNSENQEAKKIEEIDPDILEEEGKLINLSRGKRYLIFALLISLNLTVNMDAGSVPALIDEIALELKINKDIIGLFGSLQYGGSLVGKIIINLILYNIIK